MADQTNTTTTSIQEALPQATEAAEQMVESTSEDAGVDTAAEGTEGAQEQLKAVAKDPKATKAQKKEAQKQLMKLKLKIDGEEFDEEFDPQDQEYMTKQLQLAKVAQKRMQEKALIEKEVVRFVEELRKNPKKALSDPAIGLDLKLLAQQIIEEEIENSKKSPEQLEKEKLEAELKAIKEEREREKAEQKQQEFERLKTQEYERYDMLMSQALEKSDLPKSPFVVKKMADYMLLGLQAGKDVSPEDVLPLVEEEIKDDIKQLFAASPDEVIESLIGKDKLNSLRKKNIAKAKQAASNPAVKAAAKPAQTGTKAKEEKADQKKDYKKFFGF